MSLTICHAISLEKSAKCSKALKELHLDAKLRQAEVAVSLCAFSV